MDLTHVGAAGMTSSAPEEQDTLAHLSQPEPNSDIPDMPSSDMVPATLQDSKHPTTASPAAEGSEAAPAPAEFSADPADDHSMHMLPEPLSAGDELANASSQTSQGLQLPPQQLHSRLSQVPAYAQLPQVSR